MNNPSVSASDEPDAVAIAERLSGGTRECLVGDNALRDIGSRLLSEVEIWQSLLASISVLREWGRDSPHLNICLRDTLLIRSDQCGPCGCSTSSLANSSRRTGEGLPFLVTLGESLSIVTDLVTILCASYSEVSISTSEGAYKCK